jgi:serine protease Do
MTMPRRSSFITTFALLLWMTPVFCAAQTEQPTRSAEAAKLLKSDPLHVFSESVQQLSGTVTKSVVQILTTGFGLTTSEEKTDTAYLEAERGIGAGVLLSQDGYIVTNAHVVQGARKIRVRLQGLDKQTAAQVDASPHGPIEARLVGVDRQSDLAVLKIDVTGLPTLQLADSNDLKQGQVVFAFGSPLGLENSVSMGVVSATARQIDPEKP